MSKEAVLIHGWNPSCYNNNLGGDVEENVAWLNRSKLISLLGKKLNISYYNLPGFCNVQEPEKNFFDVGDFSENFEVWLKTNKKKPDLIIGYSFGGVIALDHKVRYESEIPIVLISPALIRKESVYSKLGHVFSSLTHADSSGKLKEFYQTVFSKYYRLGTPFLRESYDRIVRKNTSNLLNSVDPSQILLIYGDKDSSTPWNLVKDIIIKKGLDYILISGGGHNIGETHPKQIIDRIFKWGL